MNKHRLARRLGPVLALTICGAAPADPAAFDKVVVTASPLGSSLDTAFQSVTVIGRDEIEALPAATLAELLATVSGVDVRRRGAPGVQADIGIRGTAYEQTLVLVDGVALGDPQTGHHNFNVPVPLEHIERIEIIRGPGGLAWGGSATGGIVNIITRTPHQAEAGVAVRGGRHDTRDIEAFAGTRAGASTHLISASRLRTDGHLPERRADADLARGTYTGTADVPAGRLRWGLGAENREFGAWMFYTADFPDQRERTRARLAHLGGDFELGDWRVDAQLAWRGHDDWFRTRVGESDYINRHETDVRRLRVNARGRALGGETAIGGAWADERIESNALDDHDRKETTLWLSHRRALGRNSALEAGLGRVDYSDHGSFWLPSLAFRHRFSAKWALHASSARSARAPSYTERFLLTSGNVGRADLVPERAVQHEIGARFRHAEQALHLAVFRRPTDDLIDWARAEGEVAWQADNFDGHRSRGAEIEWQWRPQRVAVLSHLRVSYTRLSTDLDNRGKEIKYALDYARDSLAATGVFDLSPALSLSVSARYQDRNSGERATLVSARLNWRQNDHELFIEGSNLLDETVTEAGFAPLPGRWLFAGARLRF